MSLAIEHACSVALIDSYTLQFIPVPPLSLPDTNGEFNIYTIMNRLDTVNRRRFIIALNTGSSYECSLEHKQSRFTLGLYHISGFGVRWSHILMIFRDRTNDKVRPFTENQTDATVTPDRRSIRGIIEELLTCGHLAMLSFNQCDPDAMRKYIERTNLLGNHLRDILSEQYDVR